MHRSSGTRSCSRSSETGSTPLWRIPLEKTGNIREQSKLPKKKTGRLAKDMFTPEQWKLVEDALDDSNASGSEYGRVAYQQGLFDALDIFKDILLQRRDWV